MSGQPDDELEGADSNRSEAVADDVVSDDPDTVANDADIVSDGSDAVTNDADGVTDAAGTVTDGSDATTEDSASPLEDDASSTVTTAPNADEPADESVTVSFDDGETAESGSEPGSEPTDGDLRYKTTPMLRPVLVLLGSVLVGGSSALSIPLFRPDLFGGQALADIVLYAIAVLVTVTVVRLVVRLVVLWRTEYEIRDDALVRRYHLAYKRTVRKIPVSKLRGHEFVQSRYQASLGVGTIRLLTAGTNRSLGFLAFEHLRDPDAVREEIQTLLAEQADRAED